MTQPDNLSSAMPATSPPPLPVSPQNQPPLAASVLIDYHRRPPTKPSDPGYWSRFWVGVLAGPAVILVICLGWILAYVSAVDHYLNRPPAALTLVIHLVGTLGTIGVIIWMIWLLRRPVMRPWIWGGLSGIVIVPITLIVALLIVRVLYSFY